MKKWTHIALVAVLLVFTSCNKDKEETTTKPPPQSNPSIPIDLNSTVGFNILKKIKGIWAGPVTSSTPLGSFPEWIVDFRPISENQISAKNELDTLNDIFMSFFIAKRNNQYRVAFRNGGSFAGMKRVSYFLVDSVSEKPISAFYRFSEIVKGKSRAYTEVIFRADSLYMRSYTNKYNAQTGPTQHMAWSAKLQDSTSCQLAVDHFLYPKKTETKDFSTTFDNLNEAIYYSTSGNPSGDPYPETAQPYLGKVTAFYNFAPTYTVDPSKKILMLITTEPLFSSLSFNLGNLKYRSRYVFLSAGSNSFAFNYMHPGTYYYYSLYDTDGNKTFNSGDWVSSSNVTYTLGALQSKTISTQINFTIP